MFLEKKLPIAEIATKLNRTPASINTALSNLAIPRQRSLPKCHIPSLITPELARVHAHICGDGHLFSYREPDSYGYLKTYKAGKFRLRYGVAYTNLNPKLIRSFMEDVQKVFGIKPLFYPKVYRVRVKSREVWSYLRNLGAGGSREWRIPEEITGGPGSIKAAWISAFFDDEAHFVPDGGIRVRSVNRRGIEQIVPMLRAFVPCHVTPSRGLYPDGTCYLVVPKAAQGRFLSAIGSLKFRPGEINSNHT